MTYRARGVALILTVTDEPDTLLELRRDLEAAGHEVVMAADADTALRRLAASAIEVVLVDIMMSVRDGWTVLEAVRDSPRSTPVIVVSGRASAVDLARARRLGAVDWLPAPVSRDQLEEAVTRALGSG